MKPGQYARRCQVSSTVALFGWSALLALLVRVSIVAQGPTFLDRMFLPDDTYYTAAIARNLARGIGPSVDGYTLTSGFQPLTAFLLAPFHRLGCSDDGLIQTAVMLSALFGALGCGAFAVLIRRATSSAAAAWLAGLAVATAPFLLRNDLNGLETSLSSCLVFVTLLLFPSTPMSMPWRQSAWLGIAIGAMLLARIDTAFVALFIGLAMVARRTLRALCVVTLSAALVVAPWWIYCRVHFGSPIPESGAAVRQFIVSGQALVSTAYVVRLGVVNGLGVLHQDAGSAALALIVCTMICGAALVICLRHSHHPGVAILALACACQWSFYVWYLPAFWFFPRYLHLVGFGLLTCLVIGGWVVGSRSSSARAVVIGSVAMLLVFNAKGLLPFYSKPSESMYAGADGAKGYREVARALLSTVPSGARLGAEQSGALAYYADRGITVFNLDGVVNGRAYEDISQRRLADYLQRTGVQYVAGWSVNVDSMLRHSTQASVALAMIEVARFKKQGNDQFVLYSVSYH